MIGLMSEIRSKDFYIQSVQGCWPPNSASSSDRGGIFHISNWMSKEGINVALHSIVSIVYRCGTLHDRRFT